MVANTKLKPKRIPKYHLLANCQGAAFFPISSFFHLPTTNRIQPPVNLALVIAASITNKGKDENDQPIPGCSDEVCQIWSTLYKDLFKRMLERVDFNVFSFNNFEYFYPFATSSDRPSPQGLITDIKPAFGAVRFGSYQNHHHAFKSSMEHFIRNPREHRPAGKKI